jgi:hypothetical protein
MTKNTKIDIEVVLADTLSKLYELLKSIETYGSGEHEATVADIARISTAITTACAEKRQQGRDRRRDLASFLDDELVAHLKTISDRRRTAIVEALSGEDLAGKPLF